MQVTPDLDGVAARKAWRQEAFIQISQSMVARALRTDQWTYCVADPSMAGDQPYSKNYVEYQMYDLTSDPLQLLNLAGRRDPPKLVHYLGDRVDVDVEDHLRERLLAYMAEAGDPPPRSSSGGCIRDGEVLLYRRAEAAGGRILISTS